MEESIQMPCDSCLRTSEESIQMPCDSCLRTLITRNPIINVPSASTPDEVSNLQCRFLISQNTSSLLKDHLRSTEKKLAAAEEEICQLKSKLRSVDRKYANFMNTRMEKSQSEIDSDQIGQRRRSIPADDIHDVVPSQSSWGQPLLTRGTERLSIRMDISSKVPAAADKAIDTSIEKTTEPTKLPKNPATKSSKPPLYMPDRIPPWVRKTNAIKPKTDFCDRSQLQFEQQTQEDKENRPPIPKRKRQPCSEQENPCKRVRFNLQVRFRGI